jgi:FkbM family methyltransferase
VLKAYRGANKRLARLLLFCLRPATPARLKLEYLGSPVNGKTIPAGVITSDWICYSAGVGLDVSFDLEVSARYGCKVHAFDPTPKSGEYMRGVLASHDSIMFYPVGIWCRDETLVFFEPRGAGGSHSVYDLHGTESAFNAKCERLTTVMRKLRHSQIDLLKLDIEGAWYSVIQDVARQRIKIKVLCVECDSPSSPYKVLRILRALKKVGLRFLHSKKDDLLFVHDSLMKSEAVTGGLR